ncbi:MAG: enoyl-CoA hydratase/isomerase family protein [Pseudomonadales bacterium]
MSLVLFNEHACTDGSVIVEITLNAEKTLNALAYEMIELIEPKLEAYAADARVAAILLDSAGDKAFCAGGDIVSLYHSLQDSERKDFCRTYFEREYRMDHLIHTYPKPIIVWGSGIVMGGGIGLMAGASHRIVTPSSMLAMPEVTIGLYPDVGASWFLNRFPGRTGLFAGLTGARLNAQDAIFCALADRIMLPEQRGPLLDALRAQPWQREDSHQLVDRLVRNMQALPSQCGPQSKLREHFDSINALLDVDTVEQCVERFAAQPDDGSWLSKSCQTALAGSPLSLALIFEQLKRSIHMSLAQVFDTELHLSVEVCRSGDIAEGIRALLIDKDKSPHWRYPNINAVDRTVVKKMLSQRFQ